ncbi:Hsp33 family molecular chaperone HslO [Leptotrichia hongkongensis]|uniref:Hsp33 family molecular chaperone HslO n=1 Tax=Leptotrichia hongkongensis TaxID=554406 RepID=UPI0035A9AA51
MTATAMMGKDLKNEKDLVTVKVNGDGPYGNMLATGNILWRICRKFKAMYIFSCYF